MDRRKLMRKSTLLYLTMAAAVVLLNAAARNSTAFADWYIAHIFPVWVNTYGRVSGLFPFSVGEWMLGAGVALAGGTVLLGIVWAGIGAVRAARYVLCGTGHRRSVHAPGIEAAVCRAGAEDDMGAPGMFGNGTMEIAAGMRGFERFSRRYYRFFAWVLVCVCLVMTLNCFILYHASTFSRQYFGQDDNEYTLEELIEVYNMVAEQCNSLSRVMERDESGMVLYRGSIGRDGALLDMEDMARELMAQLGEDYPRLDGYYPRPKALAASDFMCQQHMQGYYFPFSMEANYNDVMHILNFPSTMCHELAHLRGYIYEDEANFIAYLACVRSEDAFFRYAGYLSVLVYLNNDIYKAWKENRAAYEEAITHIRPVEVEAQVWTDNIFVAQEEWDRINGKALIDTQIVDKAADVFIDTNLKVNGISDGAVSYSRVVRLLLQYYKMQKSSI